MWVKEAILLLVAVISQVVQCADLGLAFARRSLPVYIRRKIPTSKSIFDSLRPSEELPVFPLVGLSENQDSRLDPSAKDLDQTTLMNLLGDNYDHEFMSVVRPIESITKPNGTLNYRFKKGMRPKGEMPKEIKKLRLKNIRLPDGPSLKTKFGKRTRQKIQRFLWVYSYCPVRYTWTDLGKRYWPRWIKLGRCDNSKPCSIPAGMKCSKKSSAKKTILRWVCKRSMNKVIRNCRWAPMPISTITECKCGC